MVTGELIKKYPRFRLCNSDAHQRTIGIWRYGPDGIIESGYYDYTTGTIGPYKFRERYGYVVRFYYEKSTPPYWMLYKALLGTRTALAAFFVNNSFICLLYPDVLEYTDLEDMSREVFKFKEDEFTPFEVMNVGWVKTYLECVQVSHLPYRLQMDLNTGKVYLGKGLWVTPDGFPLEQSGIDYPMYKRLLDKPEASAVYMDVISGKETFI